MITITCDYCKAEIGRGLTLSGLAGPGLGEGPVDLHFHHEACLHAWLIETESPYWKKKTMEMVQERADRNK
jgi:hypothetical protein